MTKEKFWYRFERYFPIGWKPIMLKDMSLQHLKNAGSEVNNPINNAISLELYFREMEETIKEFYSLS